MPAGLDSLVMLEALAARPDTQLAVAPGLHGGDPAMIACIAVTCIVLAGVGLGIVFAKYPALFPRWRGWTWDGE